MGQRAYQVSSKIEGTTVWSSSGRNFRKKCSSIRENGEREKTKQNAVTSNIWHEVFANLSSLHWIMCRTVLPYTCVFAGQYFRSPSVHSGVMYLQVKSLQRCSDTIFLTAQKVSHQSFDLYFVHTIPYRQEETKTDQRVNVFKLNSMHTCITTFSASTLV